MAQPERARRCAPRRRAPRGRSGGVGARSMKPPRSAARTSAGGGVCSSGVRSRPRRGHDAPRTRMPGEHDERHGQRQRQPHRCQRAEGSAAHQANADASGSSTSAPTRRAASPQPGALAARGGDFHSSRSPVERTQHIDAMREHAQRRLQRRQQQLEQRPARRGAARRRTRRPRRACTTAATPSTRGSISRARVSSHSGASSASRARRRPVRAG